jgi:hypothetical protein
MSCLACECSLAAACSARTSRPIVSRDCRFPQMPESVACAPEWPPTTRERAAVCRPMRFEPALAARNQPISGLRRTTQCRPTLCGLSLAPSSCCWHLIHSRTAWANNLSAVGARHVEAHCDCPPGGHLRSVRGHARAATPQQLVQIYPRIQPSWSNGSCFGLESTRVLKMQRVYTSPRCICAAQPILRGIDQRHFRQRGGSTVKVARRGQPRLLIGWADER